MMEDVVKKNPSHKNNGRILFNALSYYFVEAHFRISVLNHSSASEVHL